MLPTQPKPHPSSAVLVQVPPRPTSVSGNTTAVVAKHGFVRLFHASSGEMLPGKLVLSEHLQKFAFVLRSRPVSARLVSLATGDFQLDSVLHPLMTYTPTLTDGLQTNKGEDSKGSVGGTLNIEACISTQPSKTSTQRHPNLAILTANDMMLLATLLSLFATQGLCSKTLGARRSRVPRDEPATLVDDFPWASFIDKTGIDPVQYLEKIEEGSSETLACTTASHPAIRSCRRIANMV
ncbi:hypothetical protein ACJZ2D_003059 [Fusarium nematophilum]